VRRKRDHFAYPGRTVVLSPRDEATEILSVEDWFAHARPAAGARHWKDGRSAKEMARLWLGTGRTVATRR
jgi:hypothetical protein